MLASDQLICTTSQMILAQATNGINIWLLKWLHARKLRVDPCKSYARFKPLFSLQGKNCYFSKHVFLCHVSMGFCCQTKNCDRRICITCLTRVFLEGKFLKCWTIMFSLNLENLLFKTVDWHFACFPIPNVNPNLGSLHFSVNYVHISQTYIALYNYD